MSQQTRTAALATCAFLLGILFGPVIQSEILRAEELATITVQQSGDEPASFTIASAGAPVESNARNFSFRAAPGTYTLIITPPPGFRTETTVIRNGETVSTTPLRTVPATVDGGTTLLRFVIETIEDPKQRGALSVTSTPPGITVVLKTPYGERTVRTPYVDRNAPLGRYSGVFQPRGCPTPAPVSTQLLGGGRAALHLDFDLERCSEREAKTRDQASRRTPERLTRTGGATPEGGVVPCQPSRVPERSTSPLSLGKLRSIQRKEQRLQSLQNRLMKPSSLTESSRSRFFGTKPKQRRD